MSSHLLSPDLHPSPSSAIFDSDSENDLGEAYELRNTTYHDAGSWGTASAAQGVVGWNAMQDVQKHLGDPSQYLSITKNDDASAEEERRWRNAYFANDPIFGQASDIYQDHPSTGNPFEMHQNAFLNPLLGHLEEEDESDEIGGHSKSYSALATDDDTKQRTEQLNASLLANSAQPIPSRDLWRSVTQNNMFYRGSEHTQTQEYTDWPWALAYLVTMGLFAFTGILLFMNTSVISLSFII